MNKTEKVYPLHYRHLARISGRGAFPLDMLRHDRCCPCMESDASIISSSISMDLNARVTNWTVLVMRYSEVKDWQGAWSFGRWKSFGCRVDPPLEGVGSDANRSLEEKSA